MLFLKLYDHAHSYKPHIYYNHSCGILWITWSCANSAYFISLHNMVLPYYIDDIVNCIKYLPPLFSLHVVLGFWACAWPLFCTFLLFVLWCFICCMKIWFGKINLTSIFLYQQLKQ